METQLSVVETSAGDHLARQVSAALTLAIAGHGKIDPPLLLLKGMSGRKYRIFINNLIGLMSDARYLEIGVWLGSTLCAAVYRNQANVLAIDNWSQFGGSRDLMLANLLRFPSAATVNVLEQDFRTVDFTAVGKFNVYLFDGPHGEQDHYDGIRLAQPALDERFVLIIDDWNWPQVRTGALRAVADSGLYLDFAAEIRTTLDDTTAEPHGEDSDWHNGYFIAACSKQAVPRQVTQSVGRMTVTGSSRQHPGQGRL